MNKKIFTGSVFFAVSAGSIMFLATRKGRSFVENEKIRTILFIVFVMLGAGSAIRILKGIKESRSVQETRSEVVKGNGTKIETDEGKAKEGETVDIKTIAGRIYNAIWRTGIWPGAAEDEEEAYNALIEIHPKDAYKLAKAYNVVYGKNLKNDILIYVREDLPAEKQKVIDEYLKFM